MNGHDTFVRQVIASLGRSRPLGDDTPAPARTTAAPLLPEDRPAYERLVDEVLRAGTPGPNEPFSATQLRTMALNATGVINAAAAPEYQEYLRLREESRSLPEPAAALVVPSLRSTADTQGAGPLAVTMVLAPVLSGTAAVGFLGVGYGLRLLNGDSAFVRTLTSTGWVFGAITTAAVLLAAVMLLIQAVRNGTPPTPYEPALNTAAARDAWLAALRERGLEPFLREVRGGPDHP